MLVTAEAGWEVQVRNVVARAGASEVWTPVRFWLLASQQGGAPVIFPVILKDGELQMASGKLRYAGD